MFSKLRRSSVLTRPTSAFWRPIAATASIALLIALVIGALTLSMVIVAGFVLQALLRGRRPRPVNLHWATAPIARARQRAPAGEVVDVQAREIDRP
jgi:choline-glycine betaine transporter